MIIVLYIMLDIVIPYILFDYLDQMKSKITETPINQQTATLKEHVIKSVTAHELNVREKPTIESSIIFKLNKGEKIKVTQVKDKWSKVEFINDKSDQTSTGWVYNTYLD